MAALGVTILMMALWLHGRGASAVRRMTAVVLMVRVTMLAM
jgi:hypothetical protein